MCALQPGRAGALSPWMHWPPRTLLQALGVVIAEAIAAATALMTTPLGCGRHCSMCAQPCCVWPDAKLRCFAEGTSDSYS
eukprot:2173485-Lingulodinium_polyedra.AAC.1